MKLIGKLVGIKDTREETIVNVQFNIHKFSSRPRPDNKQRILIMCCFSEFGCETIGCLFVIPKLSTSYAGLYKIAVGWYGREYFYRHLVDEYWELKEEYQWLRDYCKAFHHNSKNLARIEKKLELECGTLIKSETMGSFVVGNKCNKCGNFWGGYNNIVSCPKCQSKDLLKSLFSDIQGARKKASLIPKPSEQKMEKANQYVPKENPVGIFARGRKTYGRNLEPDFYIKLISCLESLGYNPIWLGEKQSTLPCPVSHVLDYSRLEESRDLELTCAIVSKLKFTIQFWTASTRLAAFMGVPYILFESPMQIYGEGQEGLRLGLLRNLAPIKLIISHYLRVTSDPTAALALTKRAIEEVREENYRPIIGLVDQRSYTESLRLMTKERLGIEC